MQADAVSADGGFAAGLLNPEQPLPLAVKGHTPRRYSVYRNNVTVGLLRALESNFPAIRRLLGESYFAGLAREFVHAHPPQSPLLFLYGAAFPAFLAEQGDLLRFPYLADVARLEQQWRLSYHEADVPLLHPSTFEGMDGEAVMNLRFTPHPAAALLRSPYAVHAIFLANRDKGRGQVNDPTQAECVLVTRPFYDVHVRLLSPAQFAFLSALMAGECLGDAAEQGANADTDFDLADSIRLMLEAGTFQSSAL